MMYLLGTGTPFQRMRGCGCISQKKSEYQAEKVSLGLVLTPIEKKNLLTIQAAEAQTALAK
jgi:hypothetical protein